MRIRRHLERRPRSTTTSAAHTLGLVPMEGNNDGDLLIRDALYRTAISMAELPSLSSHLSRLRRRTPSLRSLRLLPPLPLLPRHLQFQGQRLRSYPPHLHRSFRLAALLSRAQILVHAADDLLFH